MVYHKGTKNENSPRVLKDLKLDYRTYVEKINLLHCSLEYLRRNTSTDLDNVDI